MWKSILLIFCLQTISDGVVDLETERDSVVLTLMRFLYSADVSVSSEDLEDVRKLAERLE